MFSKLNLDGLKKKPKAMYLQFATIGENVIMSKRYKVMTECRLFAQRPNVKAGSGFKTKFGEESKKFH